MMNNLFINTLPIFFILDLDILQYPALCDLINRMEDSDNICQLFDT